MKRFHCSISVYSGSKPSKEGEFRRVALERENKTCILDVEEVVAERDTMQRKLFLGNRREFRVQLTVEYRKLKVVCFTQDVW